MTAPPRYELDCTLSHEHQMVMFVRILTGLCELNARGVVVVTLKAADASFPGDSTTLWMRVREHATDASRRVAIDLRDRSDRFCMPALEACDVYFKRSVYDPHLEALPPELRRKIRPFGLNCIARGASLSTLIAALVRVQLKQLFVDPALAMRQIAEHVRCLANTPAREDQEWRPEDPVEPVVIFQTRLWDQEGLGTDKAEEVNAPRIELVRRLKRELGSSFRGGLMPLPPALETHPDLITNEGATRRAYIAFSRSALVGISTRGIHHSLPLKLGEYLASSKCIVTEPMRDRLPLPLVSGEHYLPYESPEQCVQQCVRLLEDHSLATGMRRRNWEYYQNEVRSPGQMENCLRRAFAAEATGPADAEPAANAGAAGR